MCKPTSHGATCKPWFPLMCYHKYKADVCNVNMKCNYYSKLISGLNNYTTCKEIRQESNKTFIQWLFIIIIPYCQTCCNLLMVV